MAAFLTPLFLGMNPVFGKLAYNNGADPFTVAALRTVIAVLILGLFYYIFARQYLYIYPVGLINCVMVGFVNGVGSLLYYNGLNLLDASLAQLLNGMYLVFVVILTRLGGVEIGWRTILRVVIAIIGLVLITGHIQGNASWLGVGLMLGNALLFAATIVISQRALYDMPAPTVTFYALATMAVVVSMARVAYDLPVFDQGNTTANLNAMWAILGLSITTALSRLLMFFGVKGLGSVRTTLVAILEIATSITFAFIFLDESFTTIQWYGVGVLLVSMMLPVKITPPNVSPISYGPDLTRLQLFQVAFTHAFADNADKLSSQEIKQVQTLIQKDKFTTQEIQLVDELLESTQPKPPAKLKETLAKSVQDNHPDSPQSPAVSDEKLSGDGELSDNPSAELPFTSHPLVNQDYIPPDDAVS